MPKSMARALSSCHRLALTTLLNVHAPTVDRHVCRSQGIFPAALAPTPLVLYPGSFRLVCFHKFLVVVVIVVVLFFFVVFEPLL